MQARHEEELRLLDSQLSQLDLSSSSTAAEPQHDGSAAEAQTATTDGKDDTAASAPVAAAAVSRVSRAQQKRDRKAVREHERRQEVAEEVKDMADPRVEENEALRRRLSPLHLTVREMISDGHCLFRAVADQLAAARLAAAAATPASSVSSPPLDHVGLRRLAAAQIAAHLSDFLPFLTSDDGLPFTASQAAAYCQHLAQAEGETQHVQWGGHAEIVALSAALRRKVAVWSAEGGEMLVDAVETGGGGKRGRKGGRGAAAAAAEEPLRISFHRHYFGLGDHYNSVVKAEPEPETTAA